MADEKKTGHTPGPWRVDPDCGGNISGPGHTQLALISTRNGQRDEARANARLIAAAPAMAAALREGRKWALRMAAKGACDGCDPGNEGAEVWGELAEDFAAVLQKAGVLS